MRVVITVLALLLAPLVLAGCLGTTFNAEPSRALSTMPCPPLATYSPEEQRQAAAELDMLPPGAVLPGMMDDYAFIREACRP